MSPVKQFGSAAVGSTPVEATATAAVVMGKDLGAEGVNHLAGMIGKAAEEGVARPVNALTANTIATPSGGLEPKGNENAQYKYQGADMFGVEAPPAAKVK
ncbi:MAG: hypothetical protein H6867_04550 [Rhodospirillales bacterium]|nr:hypothetical protein [Rhodospirillales bacterium]MCB9996421.1 hypothetical protein [Rhodospirillales bacterium]